MHPAPRIEGAVMAADEAAVTADHAVVEPIRTERRAKAGQAGDWQAVEPDPPGPLNLDHPQTAGDWRHAGARLRRAEGPAVGGAPAAELCQHLRVAPAEARLSTARHRRIGSLQKSDMKSVVAAKAAELAPLTVETVVAVLRAMLAPRLRTVSSPSTPSLASSCLRARRACSCRWLPLRCWRSPGRCRRVTACGVVLAPVTGLRFGEATGLIVQRAELLRRRIRFLSRLRTAPWRRSRRRLEASRPGRDWVVEEIAAHLERFGPGQDQVIMSMPPGSSGATPSATCGDRQSRPHAPAVSRPPRSPLRWVSRDVRRRRAHAPGRNEVPRPAALLRLGLIAANLNPRSSRPAWGTRRSPRRWTPTGTCSRTPRTSAAAAVDARLSRPLWRNRNGTGAHCERAARRSAAWAAGESACRPGSVHPLARAGGHPSRAAVADSLVRSTREHRAGRPQTLAQARGRSRTALLTLLRVGFTEPPGSLRALVVSYTTVSPLPGPAEPAKGGLFSVALSRGSPRVGVTDHPALWSPDLPHRVCTPARPPGRLARRGLQHRR